ncbi:MAG: hypothetical protein SF339_16690 [Blastocatellia bacterium]|nr:hypothetical protein [Blastocatellia bacterium]
MRRNRSLLFASLLCAFLVISIAGQSGRKQKKAEAQPPVQGVNRPELRTQPEPEVEAESEEKKDEKKEKGPAVLVMSDMGDMNIPMYYTDTARQACVAELHETMRMLDVREGRNQTRSDAVKAAKEDDVNVVYLELVISNMGTMGGVDLRYMIYEHKTAKVLGAGSGYPMQPNRGAGMPPIGANRIQMQLDWAGRDVAQQVIKRLGLRP